MPDSAVYQNSMRHIGAESSENRAVDLAVAKGESDFERAAELANGHGVFQANPAQKNLSDDPSSRRSGTPRKSCRGASTRLTSG